MILVVEN